MNNLNNMKKLLLIAGLTICCSVAFAKPVDVQKAKIIADHFMTGKLDDPQLDIDLAAAYGAPQTAFYIFNINQDKGFVIVSADDIIMPVLGYSTESAFTETNISPEVSYWLGGYKDQIEYAVEKGAEAGRHIKDQWTNLLALPTKPNSAAQKTTTVSPLLTTTWDQMPYYNKLCPVPGGNYSSTPAGCVATAMAQIMNYWQYPAQGTGSHSYNSSTVGGTLNANFGVTAYDWANMPDELNSTSTTAATNAIATLMFHCGVSVDMDYNTAGNGGSGAFVIDYNYYPNQPCSENALKDYFGYKNTIQGLERDDYAESDWIALLKNELDNGRPILYAGFGDLGGHAFDFDGYDNNDMFHINWGWSGMSNGYFTINNLAPPGLGVGGGGGNFNSDQEALIGIEPAAEVANLIINSSINASSGSIEFNTAYAVSTNIKNTGNSDFNNGTLYLIAADTADPENTRVIMDTLQTNISSGAGYDYDFSTPELSSLPPATYFIIYGYREYDGNSIQPVNNGIVANGSKILTVLQPNGIDQREYLADYSIYPNPAKERLHVSLPVNQGQLYSILISDIRGKEVLKLDKPANNNVDIDLTNYANGIYFLRLQSDKGMATQKITIRR